MILISNRGNTNGRSTEENTADHIIKAMEKGFWVKTDLWVFPKRYFTGVSAPAFRVDPEILKLCFVEARNINALEFLIKTGIHGFYRGNSDIIYSSKGLLLTWGPWFKQAVIMNPENHTFENIFASAGVCSDYIEGFLDDNSGNA